LEKLRIDAAECRIICDLATDHSKSELFERLASHLSVLARQVEAAMIAAGKPQERRYRACLRLWLEATDQVCVSPQFNEVTSTSAWGPFRRCGVVLAK
jgi:hypothetical protein